MRFGPLPALAWGTTFLAAGYLRLTNVFANIVGDEFVFNGPSTAFHAHRMISTWEHYPRVPDFDPLLAWPHGAVAPWPQGFDLLVATLAWPASDRFEALFLIALAPVLLGLVLIALVGWATRVVAPCAPWWTAWIAATLVAIFPQAVSVARFGNPDHHIAEATIMLGLGVWSVVIWRALSEGAMEPRRRLAVEAGGAAFLAFSLSNHVATPAYVWIAGVSIVIANLRWGHGQAARWAVGAPALIASAGVIALTFVPLVHAHGYALSWYFPSYLQPLLFVVAAVACLAGSLWGWTLEGTPARRVRVLGALTAGLVACALVPGVRAAAAELLKGIGEWFGDREGILGRISENLPLFHRDSPGASVWSRAHAYYGIFGPLLPLLIPIGLVAYARRVGRGHALPFVVWSLGITLLMLQQNRFGRIGLVNLAMCSAFALTALADMQARIRPLVVASPLLAFALDPAFHFYVRPEPSGPLPGMIEASVFLREHTPSPVVGKRSGVLTPWDSAFYVACYGERPTTANGFVPYVAADIFDAVLRVWDSTEQDLSRLADRRDLGFVALDANAFLGRTVHGRGPMVRGEGGGFHWNWEYFHRVPLATLMLGGSGISGAGIPHLRHLMPRFASTRSASGLPPVLPDAWVYERVPGAVVRGHAPPDARVRLQTPVARPGQRFVHEAWTQAGADGAFTLTTPVPTGYTGAGFATGPSAVLLTGQGDPHPLVIPERAVRAGETLPTDAPIQPPP